MTSEKRTALLLLKFFLLAIGVFLGVWHLWQAFGITFVARNDEPIAFWIFILAGPLSTLPASIVSYFSPRIGGTWLICGSVLSFIAVMAVDWSRMDFDRALWFFRAYSLPMFLLGIAALGLERKRMELEGQKRGRESYSEGSATN